MPKLLADAHGDVQHSAVHVVVDGERQGTRIVLIVGLELVPPSLVQRADGGIQAVQIAAAMRVRKLELALPAIGHDGPLHRRPQQFYVHRNAGKVSTVANIIQRDGPSFLGVAIEAPGPLRQGDGQGIQHRRLAHPIDADKRGRAPGEIDSQFFDAAEIQQFERQNFQDDEPRAVIFSVRAMLPPVARRCTLSRRSCALSQPPAVRPAGLLHCRGSKSEIKESRDA